MKLAVLALSLLGATALGQAHTDKKVAPTVDWKTCETVIASLAGAATKFNDAHKDGPQLQIMCEYTGASLPKKPEQHIPLTSAEAAQLRVYRENTHLAFTLQDSYMDWLLTQHKVKRPEFGDPCWHFVGVVMDTDYITVDPNSGIPNPACR